MSTEQDAGRPAGDISFRKKLLFVSIIVTALVFTFEAGARAVFFVKEGFNPFYLTFGFVRDVAWHSAEFDGYSKFQPNSVYHQKTGPDRTLEIHINGSGFRGLSDFAQPKPPGVLRVAALGASSTFGYYDEDDETYPYLLEQMFRTELPEHRVEVMNLGIPHFRLANILALAKSELRALDPDVVTLYAGYNNSILFEAREDGNLLFQIKDWLSFHSVAWRSIHPLVREVYYRLTALLNRDVAGLPNLGAPVLLTPQQVDAWRETIPAEYRSQVEELADLVADLDAQLILITQNYTTFHLPNHGIRDRWRTYQEEVDHVAEQLREDGGVLAPLSTLLIHSDLMNELRAVASERELPLVEGIELLDADRENFLASFVHVTPEGNARLAAGIYGAIVESGSLSRAGATTR